MRVLCRHGHFAFFPRDGEDLARFTQYYDVTLEPDGDFYTFPALVGAPRWSIAGATYLNLVAVATFEGRGPWDVLRENQFVYSLETGLLVPAASITTSTELVRTNFNFHARTNLIQPGSLRKDTGLPIRSYDGEFDQTIYKLKVRSLDIV